MGMRSPNAGIGGRTQQAGTLVAAIAMPITFQPTLMPRSAWWRALLTGISTSLNYAFAAGARPGPGRPPSRGPSSGAARLPSSRPWST